MDLKFNEDQIQEKFDYGSNSRGMTSLARSRSEEVPQRQVREVGTVRVLSPLQGRLGKKLGSASPPVVLWNKRISDGSLGSAASSRGQVDKGVTALPRFGDWDVNDPSSSEDFSQIFDQARDEKRAGGASRFTAASTTPPRAGEPNNSRLPKSRKFVNPSPFCVHAPLRT